MKKLISLSVLFFLTAATAHLHAQSIRNADWKAFFGGQISDTITLHIHTDSSYASNSAGDILVRSVFTVSGDTLTLQDYDGPRACPNMEGSYKIAMTGNQLILTLIYDPCDGRVQAINGLKWLRASK